MPFPKGHKKIGGRTKGTQNVITKTVKETVLNAFIELQDDPKVNILEWGRKNPNLFYPIAAKLIPTELTGSLKNTGQIRVIRE